MGGRWSPCFMERKLIMKIIKNVFKTIRYSFFKIARVNRGNILLFASDVAKRVVISLCLILLPQKILSKMLLQQYANGFYWVMIFCGVLLLNDVFSTLINQKRNKLLVDINISLNKNLSNSIINEEYYKIEKKSFLEKIDFARRCIDRNSVMVTYDNLIEIISGVISLCGIIYIISKLPVILIVVIAIAVVASSIGEVFRLNYVYERDNQGNNIEKNLYYARNDLSSNRYAKDIRTWNLYNYISGKVELYAKALCDLWSKTSIKSVKIIGWTYLVNGLQYIVIYSFLAYMTFDAKIDISEFVLYTTATISFGDIVKKMLNSFIAISAEQRYIESIKEVTNKKNQEKSICCETEFNCCIEFKDVWFKYEGAEDYLFKGLNLIIERGKTYSIVGKNGAGKTTLVKLLLGFYKPEKGEILIDGNKIENIDSDKYQKIFSCVFQDYNIFGFSIQENISFEDNKIENVNKVLEQVGLNEKIKSLSEGINSLMNREINEKAIGLSGGQEQQLAIARALYKNSEVFILDEPTAALSPSSEFMLYQQFHKITYDKTVIFISHRLSSCVLCDEIIVIYEGRIVEKDRHEVLMKRRGLYAEMFEKQATPYME